MTDTTETPAPDTIRLSSRLELRHRVDWELWRDGRYAVTVAGVTKDALIEACTPSRLILPPGVIHGSDGKFYASGAVVRTLPDEMWQRNYQGVWFRSANSCSEDRRLYEVRPTAANPLPTPPDVCWQIPDGRICCLRKDAQALRDLGWTIHYTHGIAAVPPAKDDKSDGYILEARPPAEPDTEKVPLHELIGRCIEPGQPVTSFGASEGTREIRVQAFWPGGNATVHADADGKVEVLAK